MRIRADRALTLAAYITLVGVVAWSTFQIQRTLDEVEELQCATAEIVVAEALLNLALAAPTADFDTYLEAQTAFIAIGEAVKDRCGLVFLDEIDLEP